MNRYASKILHSDAYFFQFMRAQVSSQLSTIVDFSITLLLALAFGVFYVIASFVGNVAGGVVNCILNYKWVFHSDDSNKGAVAARYLFVWVMSIVFNTVGIFILTESVRLMPSFRQWLMVNFSDYFIVAKVIVSLLVGFVWNFQMQRAFVYKKKAKKNEI